MSAVGIFGQFLMDHQVAVDALLLVLLVALIAWALVRKLIIKPKQEAKIEELIKKIDELESKLEEHEGVPAEPDVEAPSKLAEGPISKPEAEPEAPATEVEAPAAEPEAELEDTAVEPESEEITPEAIEAAAFERERIEKAKSKIAVEPEVDPLEGKLEETIDLRDIIFDESIGKGVMDIPGEKYTSREWGEDRHGNVYTEEMLKDQIG